MTLPGPSGGRGLRFRLLGFPVRIDLTFILVLGFLGLGGQISVARLAIWIGIGAVSVLAHELGHAVAARTTGAHPTIDLYGFGGVTQYRPPGPLSRARQLSISIAGPLVGITVGLILWRLVHVDSFAHPLLGYARDAAIFVNLGWGVLNLLPVLPLDGGTVLAELLPGDAATRRRRAAAVSIVTGGLLAVFALTRHYTFGALLAGWLAFDNWRALRPQPAPSEATPPAGDPETTRSVLWLVDSGQLKEARHLVDTAPASRAADQAVHGLVLALTGQPGIGRRLLETAVSAAPGDPTRVGAYARLLVHDACALSRAGDADAALATLSRAVELGWQDATRADTDPDLAAVRALPAYAELRAKIVATR